MKLYPRHRSSIREWLVIGVCLAILGLAAVLVGVARGQEPYQPSPYAGAPVFPILDHALPHYPGRPIRNFWRVNVFGLPPLGRPVPTQAAPPAAVEQQFYIPTYRPNVVQPPTP